jgi:hypothetical protein
MNRYKKWSEREYSQAQRLMGVVFGGIVFWIIIPFFIMVGSGFIDPWLTLPRFFHGWISTTIALLFVAAGWFFADWTVKVQFSLRRGTPIPLMPTQKLLIRRPYIFCRNPMTLGPSINV